MERTLTPARASFLQKLRKLHAWIGLGGAAFGLLFGISGFLMNHRAVMKISTPKPEVQKVQMDLSQPPATIEALAADLAARYGYSAARARMRVQGPKPVRFGGVDTVDAEQWSITLPGHSRFLKATYAPGDRVVKLEIGRTGFLGAMERLHKAEAGDTAWILLADAFAGSLVFLTLSGILLWTQLDGKRVLATGLATGGFVALILVASRAW